MQHDTKPRATKSRAKEKAPKVKRKVSRQRLWQLRQREKGLCILCNEPAVTSAYCLDHAIQARERERKRLGCKRRLRSFTYRLAELRKEKQKAQAAKKRTATKA